MKIFYLVYNGFSKSYSFAEGPTYDKRKEIVPLGKLDETGLVNKLRALIKDKTIYTKRKSLLFLVDIPEISKEKIEDLFKETRVQVIYNP